jgi:hypothetical protein
MIYYLTVTISANDIFLTEFMSIVEKNSIKASSNIERKKQILLCLDIREIKDIIIIIRLLSQAFPSWLFS